MEIKSNGGKTIYILFNAAIAVILALLAFGVNQLNSNISKLADKHDRLEATVNTFVKETAVMQKDQEKDIRVLQKSVDRMEDRDRKKKN